MKKEHTYRLPISFEQSHSGANIIRTRPVESEIKENHFKFDVLTVCVDRMVTVSQKCQIQTFYENMFLQNKKKFGCM